MVEFKLFVLSYFPTLPNNLNQPFAFKSKVLIGKSNLRHILKGIYWPRDRDRKGIHVQLLRAVAFAQSISLCFTLHGGENSTRKEEVKCGSLLGFCSSDEIAAKKEFKVPFWKSLIFVSPEKTSTSSPFTLLFLIFWCMFRFSGTVGVIKKGTTVVSHFVGQCKWFLVFFSHFEAALWWSTSILNLKRKNEIGQWNWKDLVSF